MEFEKNVFISLGTASLVNQTKQKEKKLLIGIAVGTKTKHICSQQHMFQISFTFNEKKNK